LLSLGKFPKVLFALALLTAALLLVDLEAVHNAAHRLLFSNSLDFFIVVLAALGSFYAARLSLGYARQLWTLLTIALAMEAVAQAITTYYQSYVPGYSQMPLPSDILFFVWTAPVFMMFLPSVDPKTRGWDWLRILDFAQIAIVALTAYLYFFYSPSRWLAKGGDLAAQILVLYIVRDAILSVAFLFRSRTTASRGLRTFSIGLCFVFLAATLSDADYLIDLKNSVSNTSWGDFVFLFPYLGLILISAIWPRTSHDSIVEPPSRFSDFAVTHVFPLGVPLLVILMGRSIAQDQYLVAWLAISASFVCSAVRLILTNRKQRRVTDELVHAERALIQSERLLSSAFRSSPDGFSINIFPNGPYLEVSEGFTHLTGYSREEALDKTPAELNLWTEPSRRTEVLSQLETEKEIRNVEFTFRTKSGVLRTGQLSGTLLDLDGRACALVVVRDITERKAAEELLRTSEQRFRSMVEGLHVGIGWFDPEGRVQFANQAAQEMFGLPLAKALGKTGADLGLQPLHEDGSPLADPAHPFPSVFFEGHPLYSQVFGWRRPHAEEILWTLLDAIPEFDASNKLARVLVSVTNITPQRTAIDALRESEERFRTLVRDLHVAVVLHNSDTTIQFANRAALEMIGLTSDQVVGKLATALGMAPIDVNGRAIPPEKLPVPTVLRTKLAVLNQVLGWKRPESSDIIWIFGNAAPQFASDGSILRVISSFADITEMKNAERAIHQLSTQLLQLQDEERRRIGRELHDGMAQTVLAVNLSLAQLRQSAQPLSETSNRALEKARELLQQMSREIRTLSYLLHPPLLDDLGLVSALKEYVNGFSERSGIETALELQSRFRRLPQIAETAFFRITQESLSNIQRHSGSKSAKVMLREDSDSVTLEISDFGHGMNFPSNGASVPHRGQPRLGVGIPGMRERMAQLGGSLEIDSSPAGTTIRARILLNAPILREALHDPS
jgi:PAS domain S-box-containing protein